MKVENWRTQNFKDKVNHIAKSKGYVESRYDKIKYNFNNSGGVKPIRVCGVDYNDCVAFFRKENGNVSTPIPITYSEIIQLDRDITLGEIFDEKIEVKSSRKKVVKIDPYNLKVDDKCHYLVEYRNDYDYCDYYKVSSKVKEVTKNKVKLENGIEFKLYGNSNRHDKCYWATGNGYGSHYLYLGW
jgi:hypothetical protein